MLLHSQMDTAPATDLSLYRDSQSQRGPLGPYMVNPVHMDAQIPLFQLVLCCSVSNKRKTQVSRIAITTDQLFKLL